MSNPFILIARIRVKEGKVEEYLKIAKEADDAVKPQNQICLSIRLIKIQQIH